MDFAYSPHREAGGTLHLPSPSSHHSYRIEGFSSIRQLRRSLSHSPSKSSRPTPNNKKSPSASPASPSSPLALGIPFSLHGTKKSHHADTDSPLTVHSEPASTSKKSKFSIFRSAPLRSSPRIKTTSHTPMRRVLSDGPNVGNVTPPLARRNSGEENMIALSRDKSASADTGFKDINATLESREEKMRPEVSRLKPENSTPRASFLVPAKSSPLKRSDGLMNLDHASFGSPVAKRRSLHGPLGMDFDVFESGAQTGAADHGRLNVADRENNNTMSSPAPRRPSPLRKSLSLRKSTLQQRYGPGSTRPKGMVDQSGDFVVPGPAASRARQRMSLDSTFPFSDSGLSPARRTSMFEPFSTSQGPPPQHRASTSQQHPHPLSNALTSSPSPCSVKDKSEDVLSIHTVEQPIHREGFSKSLPVGAARPAAIRAMAHGHSDAITDESSSFATPEAYKMAKPLPAAFMSTGLISKRNRNVDLPPGGIFAGNAMPDTPSKRVSFPPISSSPFRRSFSKTAHPRHEFGTPTTPFSPHATMPRAESFGKGVSIFGTHLSSSNLRRRSSFASIDGEDMSKSPNQIDSQSSNDDLPPTPTKQAESRPRSKGNSLRSSLLGRRSSIGLDTFLPPRDVEAPSTSRCMASASPPSKSDSSERPSPHTPQESFTPPDPSGLSISGHAVRRNTISFNGNASTNSAFPPATPTAPRDQSNYFGNSQTGVAPMAGLKQNDVDTSLTARFGTVTVYGVGEFSQVYRVERPTVSPLSSSSTPRSVGGVWAVKRTRRPYAGHRDRERKLREVNVLKALRGHDHVIAFIDSWESKGHLYIQTEFCENGNMKDFLTQTGYKGRLDDFRIWKILLELAQGVKHIHDSGFIHLDMKPANVFIDWEGVLKIGDFGMASTWPAPPDIDGEGDREYIGPEILRGRFDKPADIFALGMIMLEIAGNIILPDNGTSWQRLRAGDLSDLPSLTWSSDSVVDRDESGDPINPLGASKSSDSFFDSDCDDDSNSLFGRDTRATRPEQRVLPPNFMVDADDDEALDKLVQWMISPVPEGRPVIDQVLRSGGVVWVEERRRAGATIYEGNWGPADDVLHHGQDVEMVDIE